MGSTEQYFIAICPHCEGGFQVNTKQFNCRIFRHGIYKEGGMQVDPHLSKEKCDYLSKNDLMWGCGKPFEITKGNIVKKCGYI